MKGWFCINIEDVDMGAYFYVSGGFGGDGSVSHQVVFNFR